MDILRFVFNGGVIYHFWQKSRAFFFSMRREWLVTFISLGVSRGRKSQSLTFGSRFVIKTICRGVRDIFTPMCHITFSPLQSVGSSELEFFF